MYINRRETRVEEKQIAKTNRVTDGSQAQRRWEAMGSEPQEGELELVMSKDSSETRKEEGDMKCSSRNVWKWKSKGLYCLYPLTLVCTIDSKEENSQSYPVDKVHIDASRFDATTKFMQVY